MRFTVAKVLCLGLLLAQVWLSSTFEPFSLGTAAITGITALGAYVYRNQIKDVSCKLVTCCRYQRSDGKDIRISLERNLKERLFGQPIAIDIIMKSIVQHVNDEFPKKALVLSFNGPTGVGKTFASSLIANGIFGPDSTNAYVYYEHASKFENMRDLYKYISSKLDTCSRSIFIYDEVDKFPEGVLDGLVHLVDYGSKYAHAIHIFISNTGSRKINELTIQMWKNGIDRSTASYPKLEKIIRKEVFNELGGFHSSNLVQKDLIDYYVAFLPLDRSHIERCIKVEILKNGMTVNEDRMNQMLNFIDWLPPEEVFAYSGCKKLLTKVWQFRNPYTKSAELLKGRYCWMSIVNHHATTLNVYTLSQLQFQTDQKLPVGTYLPLNRR